MAKVNLCKIMMMMIIIMTSSAPYLPWQQILLYMIEYRLNNKSCKGLSQYHLPFRVYEEKSLANPPPRLEDAKKAQARQG